MAPRGGKRAPPAAAHGQPQNEEDSAAGDGRASDLVTTMYTASLDGHTEQEPPSGPTDDVQDLDADQQSSGDELTHVNDGNVDDYEPEYIGIPKGQDQEDLEAEEYQDVELRPVVQQSKPRLRQTAPPQYAIPTQGEGQPVLETSARRTNTTDEQLRDVQQAFGHDISQYIISTATDVSVDDIDFDTEGMFGQCRILDDRLVERYVDGLAQGDPLSGISIVLKDCAGMLVVYC